MLKLSRALASGATILFVLAGTTLCGSLVAQAAVSSTEHDTATEVAAITSATSSSSAAVDPVASITPASISLTASEGASDSESLTIANIGGGTLTYAITESSVVAPTSSLATATIRTDERGHSMVGTLSSIPIAGVAQPGLPAPLLATDISQMDDNTPSIGGIACIDVSIGGPVDTSWLRRFYFNEYPQVGSSTSVVSVQVSTSTGTDSDGVPGTINLYTLPHTTPVDTIPTGDLTLIGSADFTAIGDLQTIAVPVTGTVDDTVNKDLVVEWHTDGGIGPLLPGSNTSPESHPTFIQSATCGNPDPVTVASIGFPDFHMPMVVTLNGDAPAEPQACDNPSDITWLSASPTSGSVAGGESDESIVTANTTGLAVGIYTANVCVSTNDPVAPMTTVPVSLTVTPAAATYTVTPSVSSGLGSILPSTPQLVTEGDTTSFTLIPDTGWHVDSASGCGGSLSGDVYTTGPITADCTITVRYASTIPPYVPVPALDRWALLLLASLLGLAGFTRKQRA